MSELRHIDLTGFQPITPADQPAPQLAWVPIANLVIDGRYQRPLNPGNIAAIKRIATEFRWSRFSPVLIAPVAGGKYAIIDGQHRAHAAAICGFDEIPAMIALVPASEQALAFIEINTRQIRVSAHSVYRAALTAGIDWAVAAQLAVAKAGCRLMTSNASTKSKRPGEVYAVTLIRQMIEAGQSQAVTAGLQALLTFEPESVPNFSDALLAPWLGAVAATKRHDMAILLPVLRGQRPWVVLDNADRLAASEGRPRAVCRRLAFTALINREARQ